MHNLRKKICIQKDLRYLDHNNFPSSYIWYSYVYSDVVNPKTFGAFPLKIDLKNPVQLPFYVDFSLFTCILIGF